MATATVGDALSFLTRGELRSIAEHRAAACVSLFMPTYRGSLETRQNPVRLKNLLAERADELRQRGYKNDEIEELLAPARRLGDEEFLLRPATDGLAVFLAEGFAEAFPVPIAFAPMGRVAGRFTITPLLPLFAADGRFLILAISEKHVRLLEATEHLFRELKVPAMPASPDDALRIELPHAARQYQSSRAENEPEVMYRGRGPDVRANKDQISAFLREIDARLGEALAGETAPLVLATVEHHLPLYKAVNSYRHLEDEVIAGNPELTSDEALHRAAWEIVRPRFRATLETAKARFGELHGTGLASSDLGEVMTALHDGRVGELFVASGREVWGGYDPVARQMWRHDEFKPGDDELIDMAACQAIATSATVFSVPAGDVPGGGDVAANFRF